MNTKRPAHEVSWYDKSNPQLILRFGPDQHEISFTVASVAVGSHEWLGGVLHRQIEELVERRVRQAVHQHQHQLRTLLGVK